MVLQRSTIHTGHCWHRVKCIHLDWLLCHVIQSSCDTFLEDKCGYFCIILQEQILCPATIVAQELIAIKRAGYTV